LLVRVAGHDGYADWLAILDKMAGWLCRPRWIAG
jgi:hypothetical protein